MQRENLHISLWSYLILQMGPSLTEFLISCFANSAPSAFQLRKLGLSRQKSCFARYSLAVASADSSLGLNDG